MLGKPWIFLYLLDLQAHAPMASFLRCWGSELRSSHLLSQCFINWATLPVLNMHVLPRATRGATSCVYERGWIAFFSFKIFITCLFILNVPVSMCVEVRGWFAGASCLLSSCGPQGPNSGIQSQQQASSYWTLCSSLVIPSPLHLCPLHIWTDHAEPASSLEVNSVEMSSYLSHCDGKDSEDKSGLQNHHQLDHGHPAEHHPWSKQQCYSLPWVSQNPTHSPLCSGNSNMYILLCLVSLSGLEHY